LFIVLQAGFTAHQEVKNHASFQTITFCRRTIVLWCVCVCVCEKVCQWECRAQASHIFEVLINLTTHTEQSAAMGQSVLFSHILHIILFSVWNMTSVLKSVTWLICQNIL